MQKKLLDALGAHYNAEIQRAEANLLVYFSGASGVGEHPDVVGEMVKLVDQIAHSRTALETLQGMVRVEGDEPGDAVAPADVVGE